MDNKFILNHNRYGCMGDCANCPFLQKITYPLSNTMQTSNYNQMRYIPYDNHIEEMVANFRNQMPRTIFGMKIMEYAIQGMNGCRIICWNIVEIIIRGNHQFIWNQVQGKLY